MKKDYLYITILILLAFPFRILFLNLMEFKFDEAAMVFAIKSFFENPILQTTGLISSTGVRNFPLFYYLVDILGIFSQNPLYFTFIIALLNSAFVIVFYILMRSFFGNTTSFFASALIATSPWMILFSRKFWPQDLIFIFLVPIMYFLLKTTNPPLRGTFMSTERTVAILFLLLTLLLQLHLSGLFLLAATFSILLFNFIVRSHHQIKSFLLPGLLGILLGLIPALPFFYQNLTTSCPDCTALLTYQQEEKSMDPLSFFRPFQILTGLGFEEVLGEDYSAFLQAYPYITIINFIMFITIILTLAGLFFSFKQKTYLLPLYFILIPVFYLLSQTPARTAYFIILAPISALLAASIPKKTFIYGLFALIILANIIFQGSLTHLISQKQVINGDYGPTYSWTTSQAEQQAKLALEKNPQDAQARANLIYTYFILFKMEEGQKELAILTSQNPLLAAQLRLQFAQMLTNLE